MLKLISQDDARRFRELFHDAGYAEDGVRKHLGTPELPSHRLKNTARLLDRTSKPGRLNLLLRLFWIGVPAETDAAEEFLPSWFPAVATECGLLKLESGRLTPTAMLLPVDDFLIASDHTRVLENRDPEFVLWPNPTTRLLSRFTVRRNSRKTLDLGTGCGMLALSAAAHSDEVIGTDINPRAIQYAAFNARLNGIENVRFSVGNGYEPVAGLKFDLIFSNPPFFITPSDRFLFCDNPIELDGLCRSLAKNASTYLNDGGYFQMLCEWAEVEGQPWHERLTDWFTGTGCDTWVLKGISQDPSEYAQERAKETATPSDDEGELYKKFVAFYRDKRVVAIHDGLVAMQKRSGENWVFMEDVTHSPRESFGESVVEKFAARNLLQSANTDEQLLSLRLKLSSKVRLEQVYEMAVGGWQSSKLTLRLVRGIPGSIGMEPLVANFLKDCDGTRTLEELVTDLSAKVGVPLEQVKADVLKIIPTLIEGRYLLA